MQLISTATVGAGGAASIDFTSIPGTYTDLLVTLSLRNVTSGGSSELYWWFNNTNVVNSVTMRRLTGSGSSVSTQAITADTNYLATVSDSGTTTNTFGNGQIYIPNYAGSTVKTWSGDGVSENNATAAAQEIRAGLWNNTAAINRITFYSFTTFAQNSTISLYGILKGSGGATIS